LVVSALRIRVGERVVEGKIHPKEEAKEKYEDAIARGDAASLASYDVSGVTLEVTVGNIMPGETAEVTLALVCNLTAENGAFCLRIPTSFFPEYTQKCEKKPDADEKLDYVYAFKVEIESHSPLTYISTPNHATVKQAKAMKQTLVELKDASSKEVNKDIVIYYKTAD